MTTIEINSVRRLLDPDCYLVNVEAPTGPYDFASYPADTFGDGPVVREALMQWIADGHPVEPYMLPTPEEARAAMPSLTARQIRLALIGAGFSLSQVNAAIEAIPDAMQREAAMVEWEYASSYRRDHPLIGSIAAVLDLTDEQIDAFWATAATL